MALSDTLEMVARVVSRETLGALARAKAARADNAERVAGLLKLGVGLDRRPLTREDFLARAATWSSSDDETRRLAAALHAVADVESGGIGGFDARGRLTILVEPHIFSRATRHAFDRSHPWLSYPTWQRWEKDAAPPAGFHAHPYALEADERWGLFAMMAELAPDAAVCAISMGRFQQLGEGWRVLRFASPEALMRKLATSERDQLDVMMTFLMANGLRPALAALDWRRVARGYNGPGQVEVYASRMADAFKSRVRTYS